MKTLIKATVCAVVAMTMTATVHAEGVGIAATEISPDPSAMLEVASTNKGVLVPRMTTARREAIALPATGLLVYDTDEDAFYFSSTNGWAALGSAAEEETPAVAFHISSASWGYVGLPPGSNQPLVLTRTSSDYDFVAGGCVTVSNDFPAFSGTTVGYFEAPVAGIYAFQVKCHITGSSSAASTLELWKNTLRIDRQYSELWNGHNPLSLSTTMQLNAGDKVMPGVYSYSNGSSINAHAEYTSFSGFLVTPL